MAVEASKVSAREILAVLLKGRVDNQTAPAEILLLQIFPVRIIQFVEKLYREATLYEKRAASSSFVIV